MTAPKQAIDTLINAGWVIPVVPNDSVLPLHSVAIEGGQIINVLPSDQATTLYTAGEIVDLPQHALIPGLINAHTHASMTLLRGYANDLPLMDWLQKHIWPAETKWVNDAFIETGAKLAIAEMLRGGTTCFNDMYFFPDVVAATAIDVGIRASVGMIVLDSPTIWAQNADDYINKGLAMHDSVRHASLITTAFAPHAPYSVSDEALQRIRMLADELDVPVHMHVHETEFEVHNSMAQFGMRPIERLDQLGLLTPRMQAVHLTQLLPGEIQALAERGVSAIHCPESNMKLASGACPIDALSRAGVNIAIGTDGAASNNDLDMFGEMRSAALAAKAEANDASAFAAHQALEAATLGGARALNLDHQVGSIEAGKAADLVAVDLAKPATWPVYNALDHVVYAASRDQVSDVWVAGKQLLQKGQLRTLSETQVLQEAANWGIKIANDQPLH